MIAWSEKRMTYENGWNRPSWCLIISRKFWERRMVKCNTYPTILRSASNLTRTWRLSLLLDLSTSSLRPLRIWKLESHYQRIVVNHASNFVYVWETWNISVWLSTKFCKVEKNGSADDAQREWRQSTKNKVLLFMGD